MSSSNKNPEVGSKGSKARWEVGSKGIKARWEVGSKGSKTRWEVGSKGSPDEQETSLIYMKSKDALPNLKLYTHCEIHPSTIFGVLAS